CRPSSGPTCCGRWPRPRSRPAGRRWRPGPPRPWPGRCAGGAARGTQKRPPGPPAWHRRRVAGDRRALWRSPWVPLSIGPLDTATTSIVGVRRRSHRPLDSPGGQSLAWPGADGDADWSAKLCTAAPRLPFGRAAVQVANGLLARLEAGVGEHPAQVDDQLSVNVLAVWRLEDLGLAAELDLDLAVGLPGGRSDGLQQRQHLAPLDVAAQRVAEDLLERDAMVVVEVRCHEASPS